MEMEGSVEGCSFHTKSFSVVCMAFINSLNTTPVKLR